MSSDAGFKPLSSEAFLALNRESAAEHLGEVRRRNLWPDSDRLHGAWWDAHKESLNAFVPQTLAASTLERPDSPETSGMLDAGRALCIGGISVAILTGALGLAQLASGGLAGVMLLGVSYFSVSLATLGVIFWVAGALEQRLIEIKQTLVAKPVE
ncbi:hypothetical protein [Brevundimonas aveniformis]|uniref:hypothetical protein n=1 Tax=Brevundimonas aveniformis TaxID=370977 RepID=UPI00249177DA|nr:hypothetical protein [Brevundimonas aveniformis]